MENVLGYDCDGEEIEEFRILRFPFSDTVDNWEEVPRVEPRLYCPVRSNDGKGYLISVYDDWFPDFIRRYEKLGETERIPIKIKSIEEAGHYEVAFDGITKTEWYYDRDRENLKEKLQILLKRGDAEIMREFKNPKARELFLDSLRIDKEADRMEEKEIAETGFSFGKNGSGEMRTEAAGLRVLADDLEDGFILEEEIDI